jgi:hypothetical protein
MVVILVIVGSVWRPKRREMRQFLDAKLLWPLGVPQRLRAKDDHFSVGPNAILIFSPDLEYLA